MNKYWIYLNSSTFIWSKGEKGIIYNSTNGKSYFYDNGNEIKKLTTDLQNIKNLYCIEIEEKYLTKKIAEWVTKITEIEAGGVLKDTGNPLEKPITFFPVLNLQEKMSRSGKTRTSIGYSSLNYLHELTLHIQGAEENLYYKQILYPYPSSRTIDSKEIKAICNQLLGLHIPRLNICGKNVINYLEANLLVLLKKIFSKITICILLREISEHTLKFIQTHVPDLSFKIICLPPEIQNIDKELSIQLANQPQVEFYFLVESEKDASRVEDFITAYSPVKYTVKPIYNGQNLSFFQKNVFLNEDDISAIHLKKREIFAHQALNENFFGKLIITPEGNIYSDLNLPPLGTVYDSIYDLIEKELTNIISWRRVRDNSVCSDCIYQWLCPSPSNYETILNQSNLCSLK